MAHVRTVTFRRDVYGFLVQDAPPHLAPPTVRRLRRALAMVLLHGANVSVTRDDDELLAVADALTELVECAASGGGDLGLDDFEADELLGVADYIYAVHGA